MSEDVRTHRQNKGRRESVPTECGQTIHGRGKKKKTERSVDLKIHVDVDVHVCVMVILCCRLD